MRLNLKIGKRASGEDISWPEIIWLILLIAFIGMFFIFVRTAINGSLINEEIYAKKIALVIDNAKPNTTVVFDVSDIWKIAQKSGKSKDSVENMIKLGNNSVKVSLRLGEEKNTAYKYFSSYPVSDEWSFTGAGETVFYTIKVGDKNV